MKQLIFYSLFPLLLNNPISNSIQIPSSVTIVNAPITKNQIAKKWYLTKTLVNNVEDNTDEVKTSDYFHFFSKGSCIFYESMFETKEIGKWTIQNNRIIVKVENETRTFIIKEINSNSMHLQISTDDPLVDMYFTR